MTMTLTLVSTGNYGKNSLKYFGPIIWNSVLTRLRSIETLTEFKKKFVNGKWTSVLVDSAKTIQEM